MASYHHTFDKGIETVRRDGCPLLVKMLEKVLRLLFTTRDLSQVKGYLYRQWTRILTDRAAVGDFIFAKEVGRVCRSDDFWFWFGFDFHVYSCLPIIATVMIVKELPALFFARVPSPFSF